MLISKKERTLLHWLLDEEEGNFSIEYYRSIDADCIGGLKCNGLEDEELQRLVDGCTAWFGIIPKSATIKNPAGYLAYVVELAEESGLALPVIFFYLEKLLKSSKTAPSIAEVSKIFDKAAEKADGLQDIARRAEKLASQTQEKLLEAFTPEALEKIRQYLPDFPEPNDLVGASQQVFLEPFGFGFDAKYEPGGIEAVVRKIKAANVWPIIPIFNMYLAAGIPEGKETAVVHFVREGRERDALFFGGYPPRIWLEAIEKAIALPANDIKKDWPLHPKDLLSGPLGGDSYEKSTEEMWQRETEIAEEQLRKNTAERKTEKCLKPEQKSPSPKASMSPLPKPPAKLARPQITTVVRD